MLNKLKQEVSKYVNPIQLVTAIIASSIVTYIIPIIGKVTTLGFYAMITIINNHLIIIIK